MPLSFLCDLLVSQQHISHSVCSKPWQQQAQASASLAKPERNRQIRVGLPTRVKTLSLSLRVLLMCSFPSKVSIRLPAVSHYLNNRISKLGTQMQPASSMNQPQSGLIKYQPTGTNPEPPTVRTLDQYQPTGNNETPLAGVDLNSDAIVDAQLTQSYQPRRCSAGTRRSSRFRCSNARCSYSA